MSKCKSTRTTHTEPGFRRDETPTKNPRRRRVLNTATLTPLSAGNTNEAFTLTMLFAISTICKKFLLTLRRVFQRLATPPARTLPVVSSTVSKRFNELRAYAISVSQTCAVITRLRQADVWHQDCFRLNDADCISKTIVSGRLRSRRNGVRASRIPGFQGWRIKILHALFTGYRLGGE